MNRRWLNAMVLCVLVLSWGAGVGCTMTESEAQRAHRIETNIDYDTRQLVEDIDMVLLLDKNSQLTRWHVP